MDLRLLHGQRTLDHITFQMLQHQHLPGMRPVNRVKICPFQDLLDPSGSAVDPAQHQSDIKKTKELLCFE